MDPPVYEMPGKTCFRCCKLFIASGNMLWAKQSSVMILKATLFVISHYVFILFIGLICYVIGRKLLFSVSFHLSGGNYLTVLFMHIDNNPA
jgi:hypothetical protein